MRVSRSLLLLGAAMTALGLPAAAQEAGGKRMRLDLSQGLRVTTNPDLDPGGDETETLATTDLGFTISTETRRASLAMTLGAQLVGELGDDSDGLEFDRPSARLDYGYRGPGAELGAFASIDRQNIDYLRALDLIELQDGSFEVPEDLDDLEGSGYRVSSRVGVNGDFGRDDLFGWGFDLRGSDLSYEDVTTDQLEDRRRYNARFYSHMDLTRTLRLTGRLRYMLSDKEGASATDTTEYGLGLTALRPTGQYRAAVSFATPDRAEDRVTVTAGVTQELGRTGEISLDLGASSIRDDETELVATLAFEMQPTRTSRVTAYLDREVGQDSDGETILSTTARAGWQMTYDPLTQFGLFATYADTEYLGEGDDTSQLGLNASMDRQLTRDWQLSVGAGRTLRDDSDFAASNSVFLTMSRDWDGRF